MILGLDVSTSIIGITVLSQDGEILRTDALDLRNKNHYPDVYAKYQKIFETIRELRHETWHQGNCKFSHIFIEQSLQMFRSGFSSAKTLSTLSSFNGVVTYLCYRELGIKPQHIPATSARKTCGIKVSKGKKAKQQVVEFLLDKEPKFIVEYTKSGNLKPKYYDIADSIVIAKAGYALVEQRKNSNS